MKKEINIISICSDDVENFSKIFEKCGIKKSKKITTSFDLFTLKRHGISEKYKENN